jgi:N,N'-diacetyllegionaminate synthase
MAGPDHWFSINPSELKKYIEDIRFIEEAIGNSCLKPTPNELKIRKIARRKIVAKIDISKGETITKKNIDYKRIDDSKHLGLAPKDFVFIENRKVSIDIKKDEPITLDMLE